MFRYLTVLLIGLVIVACGGGKNTPAIVEPVEPPVVTLPPENKYISFESGAVRPVAISPSGNQVFVTNIPNHSLDILTYDAQGKLLLKHSIPVGIEPVAVAVRNEAEVWVTNHVSDSVSIIRVDTPSPYVKRTLLVGDEPRDIVFANGKAFITTAHRGQHRTHSSISSVEGAGDPRLHEPGVGRSDIWVFEPDNLGDTLGGTPIKIIELFGDTPRALAVSPDESTVYAAVFHSGNQTTVVHESVMCEGFVDDSYGDHPCRVLDGITSPNGIPDGGLPGGRAAPGVNKDGEYQPWTSMIVQFDQAVGQWKDSMGRNFSNGIRFNLVDQDVFEINTTALHSTISYQNVGTTLFNIAVHPKTGNLLVSNTESNNATRFEGPGITGGSSVQGNIARARLTYIDRTSGKVSARPLNRHINYSDLKGNVATKQHSVATPTQLTYSQDGTTVYVAALGSDKIAVYRSRDLEDDELWDGQSNEFNSIAASQQHIKIAGGPAGLVLNNKKNQLLVYTRFNNAVVSVDLESSEVMQTVTINSPESDTIKTGRFMLYDANRSSSNGEASCAGCHIYGDSDQLAWNLGNPDASNGVNPQPFPTANLSRLGCDLVGPDDPSCLLLEVINGNGEELAFASMKGPMFTQTLRGMSTHGHMHWRGDRAVGYFANDVAQHLDEKTSFKNFIGAFEGLLGLDIDLPENVNETGKSTAVIALESDIDHLADFILKVQMPPNPIRSLDNSHSPSAQLGRNFFLGDRRSDGAAEDTNINGPTADGVNCEGCHGLDASKGFYGTRGEIAHGGEIQIFKVPQLRNLYTRVGMFGLPDRKGFLPSHTKQHQGSQIRGFGFLHDGATDQLVNFLRGGVFDNGEQGCPEGASSVHGCEFNFGKIGIPDEKTRHGLVDFLMEFDSDIAPIVGQQITLAANYTQAMSERVDLLVQRASTPFVSKVLGGSVTECDLTVHGLINGELRGYLYQPDSAFFTSDRASDKTLTLSELKQLISLPENSLTFTCQVPGMGWQMALDKDLDNVLNGDEGA